jgi:hypothetical protein
MMIQTTWLHGRGGAFPVQGRAALKGIGEPVVTLEAGAFVALGGALVVVRGAGPEEPDEHPANRPAAATRETAAGERIRVRHLAINPYGPTDGRAALPGCAGAVGDAEPGPT